jgi:hypothetical protein
MLVFISIRRTALRPKPIIRGKHTIAEHTGYSTAPNSKPEYQELPSMVFQERATQLGVNLILALLSPPERGLWALVAIKAHGYLSQHSIPFRPFMKRAPFQSTDVGVVHCTRDTVPTAELELLLRSSQKVGLYMVVSLCLPV